MTEGGLVNPAREASESWSDPGSWLSVVSDYRVAVHRDQEIIRARLLSHLDGDDPAVRAALEAFPGKAWVDGESVVLVRDPSVEAGPRWWLHLLLFLLTLFTTLMAGALLDGVDPLGTRVVSPGGVPLPLPTTVEWGALLRGAPFAVPFLGILLAHEMGHYVMARVRGIRVTPPFFIPFPAYWSVVGTLGAFIRIKGPMVRRSVLFDIGAGGPLASFILSVPVFWVGLRLSTPAQGATELLVPFVVPFAGQAIWVGTGGAVHLLAALAHPEALGTVPLVLHPLAFAGWLGFFVTALNLLPLGQLDGGHILYAVAGRAQHRAGRIFLFSLLPLGLLWWGWWLWAVVAFAVNRGRVAHPPVLQDGVPLDSRRRALGWACVVIFLLCFVPIPVSL